MVAIGANLFTEDGMSPRQTCEAAVRALADLPFVLELRRSRWYSSAPVPASDQPRYINGVARLTVEPDVAPDVMLAALQAIEHAAGRVRGVANAARTLDLDIIAYNDLVRVTPALTLPHKRAHERAFVLLPLRDVAPAWVHPVLNKPLGRLVADLPEQDTAAL